MPKTITSGSVTFVDLSDNRKLEAYITSNLPTTQIYNQNTKIYEPNWQTTNLQLSANIYLDSKEVTDNTNTSIVWYKKIGTQSKIEIGTGKTLIINNNQFSDSISIITYICEATYKDTKINPPFARTEIVFTRVDTGLNGSDGHDAPSVLAQYSRDGLVWSSALDSNIHKYIRFSYDNGATWTTAIKMTGEDGTSVTITGTAYYNGTLSNSHIGQNVVLYSDAAFTLLLDTASLNTGDAYIVQGYLCVYNESSNAFICTGVIQGPPGATGTSSYVFLRYATDANGANMSENPSGKTYIGFYTSSVNNAPTDARLYIWRKFVGDNAKSIVLSGNSQVFKISKSNGITPATITVTAQAINTTISDSGWTYSINGGQTFLSTVPSGVSRNGNIITITGATMTENSIVIKASDGTYNDVFTVYKVSDGTDGANGVDGQSAPVAFLTNENVSFSANADGQITATTFTTNVVAYKGTTKVTPTIGTITGLPTGMTVSNPVITANEGILTFSIANNETLGAETSTSGTITIPITSPVSTNLKLSWSKINTGAMGEPGTAGSDAYTVILTNESHVFAGDVSSAIAGEATTQILAYKGATPQNVTITSVNGKTATIVDADTGIAGLTFKCDPLSGTSPTITFTCTKSFVSQNGSIPIVLSVGGVSFTKMFTYSIAFKGATGNTGSTGPIGPASTAYWLISSASVIQKTTTGTITTTPSTLTFTGKSQTGTAIPINYACRWIIAYSTDGVNYTDLYTSTTNEDSKSITVLTTYKTIRARMYLAGGTTTLLDEQIIPVVVDGTSASIVDITPSTYYFKSTTGKSGTFTPEYIYIYPRFQNVSFNTWQYSVDGGITWAAASGANGLTIGTYSSVANTLRISRTSTLYTDTVSSIAFRCVSSNATVYDTVSIAKIFDVDVEEINTRITDSLAEVKTTTDSISSRVAATETSITTINSNVTSLTTRVSSAEQKITPTAIVSTVRQSTDYTNDLNKKVGTNEIISKINQTAESVTISANKIGLLGATNIPDLTADKIKGGTLTLGGSSAQTQNGQILVKNASDTDMIAINQYGMAITDGNLMIVNESELNDYGGWSAHSHTELKTTGIESIYIGANSNSQFRAELDAITGLTLDSFGGVNANPYYFRIGPTMDDLSDLGTEMTFYENLIMKDGTTDSTIANISLDEVVLPKANIILQDTAQKNIQFQNASKELRSCMLYAGANDSTTVMGAWDTTKAKSIFSYSTDNKFYILDSEAVTKTMMQNSVGERGYQKMPSGFIIQWGYQGSALTVSGNYNLTTGNITLPIAFPNSFTGIFCQIIEVDSWNTNNIAAYYNLNAKANGLTGFTWKAANYWNNWGSSILFSWMAIGY